ncbi:tol-pal system-associated acyl-CoA thioesterase [Enterobacteriales bacterium SAP-6]|uniref:Biopolymer transport protein ExbB n=2 Tax=Acerihabitans arboris TaxID=2691583 RepID=A0A845SF59_9GAMM|nr:tol-pal system-associated acyl-CoA thioesterase [Acerihabitans arboris]NDL63643.1 tol-pal system-associated acyl-CoA thioesterase [Acerihabitans arboris]
MAVLNLVQVLSRKAQRRTYSLSTVLRCVLAATLLVFGLAGQAAAAAPDAAPAPVGTAATAAPEGESTPPMLPQAAPVDASGQPLLPQMDLSVWGMYQHADVVVKTVMIGLLIASIVTWALFFGKSAELSSAKRRLRREMAGLRDVRSLDEAFTVAATFKEASVAGRLLAMTQNELELSADSSDNNGIKERVAFRLERSVAATGRAMGKGNGFLATIGAISPFIGLFGTVWGIMNSFIGIAHTQTTNLAVVAPGIAEALLATAIGLFAAIPAVVIYNVFARTIAGYKAMVGDCAAQVLLSLGRDLDLAASADRHTAQPVAKFRVG